MKLEFFDRFSKNCEIYNLIKVRIFEVKLFHAERLKDGEGQTNMTKLIFASYSFANGRKNL
jgi:hypothetical protein